ncbi:MAG: transposase, partial [Candidatus Eisenbacteria bacterium]
MTKPARRFVVETVYGIQARQSVLLSEIGRALNESISLKKTETRLSNELKRSGLGAHLLKRLLMKASGRIKEDTLLVLDLSDIAKRYARGMEYLTQVRDGSTGEITSGYWLLK